MKPMKILATVFLRDSHGRISMVESWQPAISRARSWIGHQRAHYGEFPDGEMTSAIIELLRTSGREVVASESVYGWSAFEREEV